MINSRQEQARVTPLPSLELSREFYEDVFRRIAKLVSKLGGSLQEAKDICHDALIIYYERRADNTLVLRAGAEHYIVGVAKHLWLRRHEADRRYLHLDAFESTITVPPEYFPSANTRRLLRVLASAGKKCLDLLHAFYYGNRTTDKLANALGYRNAHSLSVQKHKCLEKVKLFIAKRSLHYEDFFE